MGVAEKPEQAQSQAKTGAIGFEHIRRLNYGPLAKMTHCSYWARFCEIGEFRLECLFGVKLAERQVLSRK